MTRHLTAACTLALTLAAGTAQAVTEFVESATPGGDYADVEGTGPDITSTGTIPLGVAELTGGLRLDCGDVSYGCETGGLKDSADAFFFTLDADLAITALSFELTPASGVDISTTQFALSIDGPSGSGVMIEEFFQGTDTVGALIAPGSSLGPGTYSFFLETEGSENPVLGQVGWTLTSTIISTAAPVPLPASGAVLLAGLGVFGALRRRER